MTLVHPLLAALLTATAAQAGITISINAVDTAFEPNSAAAAVGDVVEFHFQPSNHSVVRGELDKACEPLEKDGFFSGFVPVKEGETEAESIFRVKITDTKPIYFYCSQAKHCQSGMFGVINPSSSEDLDKYKAAAEKASENKSPAGGVAGGELVPASSAGTGVSTDAATSGHDSMTMTTTTGGTATATATETGTNATSKPSSAAGGHAGRREALVGSWLFVAGMAVVFG